MSSSSSSSSVSGRVVRSRILETAGSIEAIAVVVRIMNRCGYLIVVVDSSTREPLTKCIP